MSESDQDAIIGRTLREYRDAKKELSALHAEAERIGNYLTAVGHALLTHHALSSGAYGSYGGKIDAREWPTVELLNRLSDDIERTRKNKERFEKLLTEAGYPLPKE
jgi:hypothetical protein